MLNNLKGTFDRRFPVDDALAPDQVENGLRGVLKDGLASQAMGTLTSGPFLVGYALAVGGGNTAVGILAAIPFFAQLLQLPAVSLIEALRRRRAVCIVALSISRLFLLPMAAAALAPQGRSALGLLVLGLAGHAGFGAIAGCSWNSWMRDLVPEHRLGAFLASACCSPPASAPS
jgi:MFS family permease